MKHLTKKQNMRKHKFSGGMSTTAKVVLACGISVIIILVIVVVVVVTSRKDSPAPGDSFVPSSLQGKALEPWSYDDFVDTCTKQKGRLPTAEELCAISKSQGPGPMWVPIKPAEIYKDNDRYKWMQISDSDGGKCNPLSIDQHCPCNDKQLYHLHIVDFGMYNGTYYYDSNDTEKPSWADEEPVPGTGKWKVVGDPRRMFWHKTGVNGWTAASNTGDAYTLSGGTIPAGKTELYPGQYNRRWSGNDCMVIPMFILDISNFLSYNGKYYYDSNDTAKPPNSKDLAYPGVGKWKKIGDPDKFFWRKGIEGSETCKGADPGCGKNGLKMTAYGGWTAGGPGGDYVDLAGPGGRDSYPGQSHTLWMGNYCKATPDYQQTYIWNLMSSATVPEKGQYVCMIPK